MDAAMSGGALNVYAGTAYITNCVFASNWCQLTNAAQAVATRGGGRIVYKNTYMSGSGTPTQANYDGGTSSVSGDWFFYDVSATMVWPIGKNNAHDAIALLKVAGQNKNIYHLHIVGSGATVDYANRGNAPWYGYQSVITDVVIPATTSITILGNRLFDGGSCTEYKNLQSVSINNTTLTNLSEYTFGGLCSLRYFNMPKITTPPTVTSTTFTNTPIENVLLTIPNE